MGLMNATLPMGGQGNAMRTWTWQTCNEFGYFQTARAEFGHTNFYTRGASSRALWQQVCNDVFGITMRTWVRGFRKRTTTMEGRTLRTSLTCSSPTAIWMRGVS